MNINLKQRPNILFVFSDQQRYGALGANGNRGPRGFLDLGREFADPDKYPG